MRTLLLRRPDEVRTISVTYDRRDKPPWTVELKAFGRTRHIRSGESIESAIMAVDEADR